jgi:hypothetical protein
MKNFILNNWYKLSIAISLLIASFAFLIFSAEKSFADPNKQEKSTVGEGVQIVANQNGVYAVLWGSNPSRKSDFDVIQIYR